MFELDQQIAQEIVDRAMGILSCNINVMDSQGLILASAEQGRVNTRHEGAQLVLANQRAVEIDPGAAASLRGVQGGVNLPLSIGGQVVGVIGLSGSPDEVRTYAELMKMAAEMLLSQHYDNLQLRMADRCSAILESIVYDAELLDRTLAEAKRLGLKPHLKRSPYLIEFSSSFNQDAAREWLARQRPDCWCLSLHDNQILWCVPSGGEAVDVCLPDALRQQGYVVNRVVMDTTRIATTELRTRMQQLLDLSAYAQEKLQSVQWLDLTQHRIPAALWRYRTDPGMGELLSPFQRLIEADTNGLLRKTLTCWFDHAFDGPSCAAALAIHRNSLRNRLERITDVSGIDFSTPDGLVILYLGLKLSLEQSSS